MTNQHHVFRLPDMLLSNYKTDYRKLSKQYQKLMGSMFDLSLDTLQSLERTVGFVGMTFDQYHAKCG